MWARLTFLPSLSKLLDDDICKLKHKKQQESILLEYYASMSYRTGSPRILTESDKVVNV